jgi:hypothetical protein
LKIDEIGLRIGFTITLTIIFIMEHSKLFPKPKTATKMVVYYEGLISYDKLEVPNFGRHG